MLSAPLTPGPLSHGASLGRGGASGASVAYTTNHSLAHSSQLPSPRKRESNCFARQRSIAVARPHAQGCDAQSLATANHRASAAGLPRARACRSGVPPASPNEPHKRRAEVARLLRETRCLTSAEHHIMIMITLRAAAMASATAARPETGSASYAGQDTDS